MSKSDFGFRIQFPDFPMKSLIFFALSLFLAGPATADDVWLGKAISKDWFFRDSKTPPIREIISLQEIDDGDGGKTFEFSAFGKKWRLTGVENSALFSEGTKFEERTEKGETLSSRNWKRENCFYVGRASTGSEEAGVASFSTCHGLRAVIVTNRNDYVIQPARSDVAKRGMSKNEAHHIHVEPRDAPNVSSASSNAAKSPVLERLVGPAIPNPRTKGWASSGVAGAEANRGPTGNRARELTVELGIIVDQEYVDTVKRDESPEPDWLMFHILERVNWIQLWYLHPTFGYTWWWYIHRVIINDKPIDYSKYDGENWDTLIDKVCNWQSLNQPDSDSWDHTLIMSSKPHIWGTRPNGVEYIGRAIADGACDKRKHCVGVKDMNFQWGTWTRLAAHECAHGFGVPDDYPESGSPTSAECFAGLMRQGVYQDFEWSRCSVETFEEWRKRWGACLDESPNMAKKERPMVEFNAAYRARAHQSSRFGAAEEFGAQKATDGPLVGVPMGLTPEVASCTQTKKQKDPFVRIELDEPFRSSEIRAVHIFNRPDCCSSRLHDAEIRIGFDADISANPLCGVVGGVVGDGAFVECTTPMKGRYVTVQIKGPNEILTVCEIQVLQHSVDAGISELPMPRPLEPVDADNPDCRDDEAACRMWANRGECWKNPSWMTEHCERSCGVCGKSECHDFDPDCASRAAAGECVSNAAWMTSNCPVSCSSCTEVCADFHKNCASWAMLNECEKNPGWMGKNCRKSCELCGDPDCVDTDRRCPDWKDASDCVAHPDWMTKNCPKSCNGCKNKCEDAMKKCPVWAKDRECVFNPGWMGIFCRKSCETCLDGTTPVCKDKHDDCKQWTKDGNCESNPDFMLTKCERSCGACGPLKPTVDPNACEDKNKLCTYWAALGECAGEKKDYMEATCPLSCLVCTDEPPPCEDSKPDCAMWADGSECITNAGWMWANCRKSCGICGGTNECVESDVRCAQWAEEGECENNPNFMLKSCQKSCKVCDEDHPCENKDAKCWPWAHTGKCLKEPEMMKRECRKACNLCGCLDRQQHCPDWARSGECESNPTWMKVHCRKSCGMCEGGGGVTPTTKSTPRPISSSTTRTTTTSTTTTNGPTPSPATGVPCVDKHTLCRRHVKEGMCSVEGAWGDWMSDNCARACKFCDPTTSPHEKGCTDKDGRCPELEKEGKCEQWLDWVWEYCRKSCGFCN